MDSALGGLNIPESSMLYNGTTTSSFFPFRTYSTVSSFLSERTRSTATFFNSPCSVDDGINCLRSLIISVIVAPSIEIISSPIASLGADFNALS